ncbi:F0F1 ATP synthase subunit gamma [Rickettsiales bacterium]|nr:F0F1 ATP synthase subunit gamma [Rickettsiales bacterium]
MSGLKAIKNRIKSTQSVIKVTKVVNLIATGELKITKQRYRYVHDFYRSSLSVFSKVVDRIEGDCDFDNIGDNILSSSVKPIKFILDDYTIDNDVFFAVVISSNKGLCGSLNSALHKKLKSDIDQKMKSNPNLKVYIHCVGEKIYDLLKGMKKFGNYENVSFVSNPEWYSKDIKIATASMVAENIMESAFDKGASDMALYYNRFINILQQEPSVMYMKDELNAAKKENKAEESSSFEIDGNFGDVFFTSAINFYTSLFFEVILSNVVSENAIKMLSMDNATKSGNKLVEKLILQRNKIRQSMITRELLDIIGGASATES